MKPDTKIYIAKENIYYCRKIIPKGSICKTKPCKTTNLIFWVEWDNEKELITRKTIIDKMRLFC